MGLSALLTMTREPEYIYQHYHLKTLHLWTFLNVLTHTSSNAGGGIRWSRRPSNVRLMNAQAMSHIGLGAVDA